MMEEPRIGVAGLESGPTGRVAGTADVESLRRLFEVGRGVLSELDPEVLLDRVLETARKITGARYAALGVLDESRRELERFLVRGIDPGEQHAIGDLPRGRGVLGELITSPLPLRLADVGQHPHSYGFPAGHPPMSTFLGVPIMVRGQAWGNLYLTEKASGEFDQADEEAVVMLADWAGIAIEHARLCRSAQQRGEELERAMRGLEAARAIALAIGGTTDLGRVLELIVKRGRALVQARSLLILLREGQELVVVATAGEVENANGQRIPIEGSTSGEVLTRRRPERIPDVKARLRIAPRVATDADRGADDERRAGVRARSTHRRRRRIRTQGGRRGRTRQSRTARGDRGRLSQSAARCSRCSQADRATGQSHRPRA